MLHRIKDIIRTSIPDLTGRAELRQKIANHPDTFDPAPMMHLIDIIMDKLTNTALTALDTDRYSQVLRSLGRQVIAWTRWNLKITAEEEIQRDRTWKRQVRSDLGGKPALVRWDLMQRRARQRIGKGGNSSFSPPAGRAAGRGSTGEAGDGGSGDTHLVMGEQSPPAPHPLPSATRTPGTAPRKRGEGETLDLPDYSEIFGPIKPAADWVAEFDARDAETKNTPSTPITPVWPQAKTGAHLPKCDSSALPIEVGQTSRTPSQPIGFTQKIRVVGRGRRGSGCGTAQSTRTDISSRNNSQSASNIRTDRDGLFRLAKIARPMTAPRQITQIRTTHKPRALVGPWQPIELTADELRDVPDHPFQKGYWPKDMLWLKDGESVAPLKEHPD